MKLENALALKSILQVRHIVDFLPREVSETVNNETVTHIEQAALAFTIYASNNLHTWVQLKSLHGTPCTYYRFKYEITNMGATDTFAGTLLITDERRSLRLR